MALTDAPSIDITQAYGYASVTVVTAGRTLTFEPGDSAAGTGQKLPNATPSGGRRWGPPALNRGDGSSRSR